MLCSAEKGKGAMGLCHRFCLLWEMQPLLLPPLGLSQAGRERQDGIGRPNSVPTWRKPSAAPDPAAKLRAAPTEPAAMPMDLRERCGIHLKPGIRRGPVLITAFLSPAAEVGVAAIDRACRRARPVWPCWIRGRATAPSPPRPDPRSPVGRRRPVLPATGGRREKRATARVASVGALYNRVKIAPLPVVVERKGRGSGGDANGRREDGRRD
ncbi:unnamed protein product [Urochloa humidicola]